MRTDRFVIEDKLWIVAAPTGVPIYDFAFRQFFECRTPYHAEGTLPGIARIGAFDDYRAFYEEAERGGIALLNTPEEQERCSTLPAWHPLIAELTPRSRWYAGIPSYDEIAAEFALPVFVKGARQTSRHRADSCIIRTREDYERVSASFGRDSILHWQQFVCREFIPLRRVEGNTGDRVPPSFEFRTFWRRGDLLAAGRYWYDVPEYRWSDAERASALALAAAAAARLDCGFLVIDLAMTEDGRWIIIECNDGMESGYAGASPFALWRALLDGIVAGPA